MADDLNSKVAEWLRTEGYPFEMRVARIFNKAGFHVAPSDYYLDPETKKPREIDLVASIQKSDKDLTFRIKFAIECKNTTDKPWIVLSNSSIRAAPPFRVAQRISNSVGLAVLMQLCQNKEVQNLELFMLRDVVGYSVVQGLSSASAPNTAYTAVLGATSAATAMSSEWDDNPHVDKIGELIFPVVAISGRLFRCQLEETMKEMDVTEIFNASLLWRNASQGRSATIIDIQTAKSVESFAEQMATDARLLLERYFDVIKSNPKRFRFLKKRHIASS